MWGYHGDDRWSGWPRFIEGGGVVVTYRAGEVYAERSYISCTGNQAGSARLHPWHLLPGAKQASLDCPLHEQRTRRVGREQADGLLGRERGASEIAAEIDDEIG